MPRTVTIGVGYTNIQLPNGLPYDAGEVAILTDAEWANISPTAVSSGVIIDGGAVSATDAVSAQATTVAAPAAIASAAAVAAPTKAEYDTLRTDVVNVRTTLASTLTNLKGVGKAMAP